MYTHTHQTALSCCMTHASRDHTRKDNTIALGIGYKHYPILLQRVTISLVSFNSSFYLTNRCGKGALYHFKEDRVATPWDTWQTLIWLARIYLGMKQQNWPKVQDHTACGHFASGNDGTETQWSGSFSAGCSMSVGHTVLWYQLWKTMKVIFGNVLTWGDFVHNWYKWCTCFLVQDQVDHSLHKY